MNELIEIKTPIRAILQKDSPSLYPIKNELVEIQELFPDNDILVIGLNHMTIANLSLQDVKDFSETDFGIKYNLIFSLHGAPRDLILKYFINGYCRNNNTDCIKTFFSFIDWKKFINIKIFEELLKYSIPLPEFVLSYLVNEKLYMELRLTHCNTIKIIDCTPELLDKLAELDILKNFILDDEFLSKNITPNKHLIKLNTWCLMKQKTDDDVLLKLDEGYVEYLCKKHPDFIIKKLDKLSLINSLDSLRIKLLSIKRVMKYMKIYDYADIEKMNEKLEKLAYSIIIYKLTNSQSEPELSQGSSSSDTAHKEKPNQRTVEKLNS